MDYISTSGGIITNQFIETVYNNTNQSEYMKPEAFSVDNIIINKSNFNDEMATAWELLYPMWDRIAKDIDNEDVGRLRSRWLIHIFSIFDYSPVYLKKSVVVDDEERLVFNFSHRGWEADDSPIIHMVKATQDLDKRDETLKSKRKSPHDMMQTFLNTSSNDKWGIITNGKKIRILRQHHLSYTKGYIEFDIAGIFEGRKYAEFCVLYKFLHKSRFVKDKSNKTPLDYIYEFCVSTGSSIGFGLQKNVKTAIELIGNGFLKGSIITKLQKSEKLANEYYSEILNVIYRILFLLYAEQRGLMPGRTSLYMNEYSITSIRNKVEGMVSTQDIHTDIWEGLKVTFKMVSEGVPELELYPYNGVLFNESSTKLINELACTNRELLMAIKSLTLFEKDGVLQRINYSDLGVEELGSIYESLLDFSPRVTTERETFTATVYDSEEEITVEANTFLLDPRGSARKQSGSYYTNTQLVDQLIKSALIPVVKDKVNSKHTKEEKEKALLSIKVCDCAAGSGPFLIGANNYLGIELAKIRQESDYPDDLSIRIAKRDVLSHCIYGVDINPMAVELCKVSLWINACVRDYPLNFLDHHIKCGNSLVGATSKLINEGIRTEAFEAIEGDDKALSRVIKARNRQEQSGQISIFNSSVSLKKIEVPYLDTEEITPEHVHEKEENYICFRNSSCFIHKKLVADMWTSTFYWEIKEGELLPPTYATLENFKADINSVDPAIINKVKQIADDYKFFHWHLEFPEVFDREEKGFDCILGNPPWEAVVLKEKEYFESRDINIFSASTAAKRKELIEQLKYTNIEMYQDFHKKLRSVKCESAFLRGSSKYKKSAKGTINTYAIFTDLVSQLISDKGRAGIIVQTGIAVNDGTKYLFGYFVDNNMLASLFDFENRERIFPIHSSMRFCLLTIAGKQANVDKAKFICYATKIEHLQETKRYFTMSSKELKLVNPYSKTIPSCRNNIEKEILLKIYNNSVVLQDEYGRCFSRMFDMSLDSHLFRLEEELEDDFLLNNNMIFAGDEETYIPLYEAKLFHQYQFNFATFEGIDRDRLNGQNTNEINNAINIEPSKPRFWIKEKEVKQYCLNNNYKYKWFVGIRVICRSTDERTSISSIIPLTGNGNSIGTVIIDDINLAVSFVSMFNSFAFDFVSRLKVGGINYNFWIAYQQPVILLKKIIKSGYFDKIKENVLKLTYYHELLKPFALDLGYEGEPFEYNDNLRFNLICEIDAIYGKLYGLTEEEFDYILETFPIVKQKDIAKFGRYKTKETILEFFNSL